MRPPAKCGRASRANQFRGLDFEARDRSVAGAQCGNDAAGTLSPLRSVGLHKLKGEPQTSVGDDSECALGAFVSSLKRRTPTTSRSSTITEDNLMPPVAHPGPLSETRARRAQAQPPIGLSLDIGVPSGRITDILNGRPLDHPLIPRSGLGRYFGNRARFWLDLQSQFEHRNDRARKGQGDRQARAAGKTRRECVVGRVSRRRDPPLVIMADYAPLSPPSALAKFGSTPLS